VFRSWFCYYCDSSVGIATGYGLGGPGIECRWGEVFRVCPYRPWGPPNLLYNGYRVSFPEVKRPGRGVNHPLPSSAEVKERVELYLHPPSGPSWPVLRQTLPFFLVFLCSQNDCSWNTHRSKGRVTRLLTFKIPSSCYGAAASILDALDGSV
jgi:hypothetical protein